MKKTTNKIIPIQHVCHVMNSNKKKLKDFECCNPTWYNMIHVGGLDIEIENNNNHNISKKKCSLFFYFIRVVFRHNMQYREIDRRGNSIHKYNFMPFAWRGTVQTPHYRERNFLLWYYIHLLQKHRVSLTIRKKKL